MALPETLDPTGWTAALLGLFAVFAAIGALRQPGIWRTLIDEVAKSPTLQILSGFVELFFGAAIYLVNPWVPSDVLACVMKAMGGLMMVEALAVVGFSDIYFQLWLKNLAAMHRCWAVFTLLVGAVLGVAGFVHMI